MFAKTNFSLVEASFSLKCTRFIGKIAFYRKGISYNLIYLSKLFYLYFSLCKGFFFGGRLHFNLFSFLRFLKANWLAICSIFFYSASCLSLFHANVISIALKRSSIKSIEARSFAMAIKIFLYTFSPCNLYATLDSLSLLEN